MISAVLVICATVFILGTTIALWRAPDALTRINLMGPTVGVALPLLVLAHLFSDPFDWHNLVRALLAIAGLWIVAAVSSFYIARSVHEV
ncbi:putative monovalent cation/H+ antiporter subunit G [Corynebacterium kalinowskii]|uniref:Monovalent cation/H+ antiporter subunit G n=1 Tax=Corynebacterium kalinowskii TaxID=2675216 RepID=A0A6B8W7G7_9CORY|nr:Na+/H+ antiporter subunit G [Corynebacterium kalinowskii]QGU03038.1 putative monovalent cation/H+ antiporter subunit G [Corynebacterium kalinowskii]